jgi:hypothetical protein
LNKDIAESKTHLTNLLLRRESLRREISISSISLVNTFFNNERSDLQYDSSMSADVKKILLDDWLSASLNQEKVFSFLDKKQELQQVLILYDQTKEKLERLMLEHRKMTSVRARNETPGDFVCPCPASDCRGFLDSKWSCPMCRSQVCNLCREIKNSGTIHACNPDNVASTQLIENETRSCPNCGVCIERSVGCDHMFCIQCKTGFSWRTGLAISNRVNTNPYFFDWLRSGNSMIPARNIGDVRCGGIPQLKDLVKATRRIIISTPIDIHRLHHSITFFQTHVIPMYHPTRNTRDHQDLRIAFLLGEIDEDTWKKTLKTRQKRIEKNNDVYQVLEMFLHTITDMLIYVVQRETKEESIQAIFREIWLLKKYMNEQLLRICDIYGIVSVPFIDDSEWSSLPFI